MKTKILATVSALAIIGVTPAMADTQAEIDASVKSKAPAHEQSTGNLKKDAKKAWEDIKSDTSKAYNNIKATLIDDSENAEFSTVMIDPRITAAGMIGQKVYNGNGEAVAKVHDIIVDRDGKAIMVVVSDGAFIGVGKKAAFDYNSIVKVNADGDIIMPLTEAMIDTAAEFSYDREEYSDSVRVIPSNGYSVADLLEGQLVDQKQDAVADVDNISFKNGRANQLIVGFDKVLGLGGEKATLTYGGASLIRDGDGYDFQLSANQAAQFEQYKKTMTN